MVVHAFNLIIQDAEAGDLKAHVAYIVSSQASQGNRVRPYLKKSLRLYTYKSSTEVAKTGYFFFYLLVSQSTLDQLCFRKQIRVFEEDIYHQHQASTGAGECALVHITYTHEHVHTYTQCTE